MKGQIRTSIFGVAAAVTLGACASTGPVSETGMSSATAGAPDATSSEYQSLIDNARSQTVCRRETVTGSHIIKREVCLTRAQMDAEREDALRLIDDMKAKAAQMPQPMLDRSTSVPSTPPRAP